MNRISTLGLLAALTVPCSIVAQGRETDTLSISSPLARVAYLTQLDRLDDTRSDDARCSAAASLNAFVLLGGSVDSVARLFGLPLDRTIGTAHRVQERLYLHADVDGVAGVIGSTKPVIDATGAIVASRRSAGDEFHRVLDVLGLRAEPLFGATMATVAARERAVTDYMRRTANPVFIVGADADLSRGARPSRAPTAGSANHYIVIARVDGVWQKVDSWYRAGQQTVSRLTEAEVRGFLHQTPVTPWGVVRDANIALRLPTPGYDGPPEGRDLMSAAKRATVAASSAATPLVPLDLFRLETVNEPQLSPDGTRVVYVRQSFDIMRDRKVTQLWLVNADGSMHRRLTAGDGNERAPRWTPSGDAVIYLSSVDGTTQMYRRDVASEQTVRLAKLPSTPEWFTISPDGSQIAFAMLVATPPRVPAGMPTAPAGATWAPSAIAATDVRYRSDGAGLLPSGRTELFVVPATGGTARKVTAGGVLQYGRAYGATPGIWTPDGAALIVTANGNPSPDLTSRSSDLFEVRVADGDVKPVFRRRGTNRSPAISPDGKWLAFVSVADSGHAWTQPRLWLVPRTGDAKPKLLSAGFDAAIDSPAWLPDGNGLLFLADREGRAGLWRIALDGTTTLAADSLASDLDAYGGGQAFSMSRSGALAMTRGSPTVPGDVWFATTAGTLTKQLTAVNDDVFADRRAGQVSSFWAKSSKDGQRFQSWIITPPGYTPGKKYPTILEIHGGPFAAYGDRFDIEKQWMAAQGYVVLYVNPRGSTSYGEAFARLIDKTYPGDDADDLLTAVDSVVARGLADPAQLYVTGGSGGGLLTAWLTARTTRFRAAAVLYPVIDWTSEVLTADNGSHFQGHWLRGAPWENPTHYWAQSPLSRVASVQTPTLVMGGDGDYRTPFGQSEEWFTALRLRGVPTELVRIPGESHGARDRPSHHIAKVAYITDWFTRHRDTPCCALPAAENTAALTAFADSAARGDFGYVDAVHVVRNGVPLISRTFPRSYEGVYAMKKPPGVFNYQDPNWHPFYQGRTLHTLQSVSKSIVSLVYGVAIARKDIATIDQPIAQFIPAHAAAFRDSVRRKITIRHLLTMTSGISWPEGGGYGSDDDITQRMENSSDWVSLVLAQPMETEPGTKYHYNDGAAALLAEVFRGATGVDLQVYAERHLFAPLGITRFHWKRSSGGLTDSEGGLYLEPADLAKLGQLMLDQGMWNGTRLVSAEWVAESVRGQQPVKPGQPPARVNYGLMWWTVGPGVLQDSGAYFGWGYGGQYVFVFPKTRTVAVLNQWMFQGQEIQPIAFARRIERAISTMP
ncbi:MAG: prolyl oligopeptidase family serine peptidase [Gemmatimonadetes bacterium]|nr:prolyl oligopeptidase family serine peptidase [Gemmatimonadota bacterium]